MSNNKIRYNEVHHVMQALIDGGGIYTLGRQTGTQLYENYIHDIRVVGGCIPLYNDNYSEFITVEHNVFANPSVGTIFENTGNKA